MQKRANLARRRRGAVAFLIASLMASTLTEPTLGVGALLDEGFLDYWRSVPLGGPLFPNVPLDTYGKRASKVTTECSIWLRNVVKITDPTKPFYSHRHTATSYLRNTRLPDGSPAVKEDIERYILGRAGKGAHAGYGKRWFETLKAAVEVIPNPLAGSVSEEPIPQ